MAGCQAKCPSEQNGGAESSNEKTVDKTGNVWPYALRATLEVCSTVNSPFYGSMEDRREE